MSTITTINEEVRESLQHERPLAPCRKCGGLMVWDTHHYPESKTKLARAICVNSVLKAISQTYGKKMSGEAKEWFDAIRQSLEAAKQ